MVKTKIEGFFFFLKYKKIMLKHSKHIMFFFSLLHISQDKREKRKEIKKRSSRPCWESNNDTHTTLKERAG